MERQNNISEYQVITQEFENDFIQYRNIDTQDNNTMQNFEIQNNSVDEDQQNENENQKKIKKTIKKQKKIKNITCIILLLAVFYLFAVELNPVCNNQNVRVDMDCVDNVLLKELNYWVNAVFGTSVVIFGIFFLAFIGKLPIINMYLSLAMFIILTNVIYGPMDYTKISVRDYTAAIQIGLFVFVILEAIFTFNILLLIKLYKHHKKYFKIFMFIQLLFILKFTYNVYTSCEGWEYGLVGKMDESEEYCKLRKPKICWQVVVDNVFRFGSDTCALNTEELLKEAQYNTLRKYRLFNNLQTEEQREEMLKNTKYIAWRNQVENIGEERESEFSIIKALVNNIKIFDIKQEAIDSGREIIIDVQNMKLDINMQYNQTLVEERRTIAQEVESESMAKNIIMVYIDTVSRAHSLRKLKKSMNFLKKYADYNSEDYKKQELKAKVFEFFRYHAIDRKTFQNAYKFRYNIMSVDYDHGKLNIIKHKNKKIKSIFNEIKNAGYIFGHAANSMSLKSSTRGQIYRKKFKIQQFLEEDIPDHEFLMFDPQYLNQQNPFGINKGANSVSRRCIYGNDTNYFPFLYGQKFLDTYQDEKKFLLIELTDGHEMTNEVVQFVDDNLHQFLLNIEDKGYFKNDTIIYFVSDHGQHMMKLMHPFQNENDIQDSYSIEKMLPFFYMSITNDILIKYENYQIQHTLELNQQRIFGLIQYRNSLLLNTYGIEHQYNNSTVQNDNLYKPLDTGRTCLDIGRNRYLPNDKKYCSCDPLEGYDEGKSRRYGSKLNSYFDYFDWKQEQEEKIKKNKN